MRAILFLSVITFFTVLLLSVMIQSLRIEGQSHLDQTSRQVAVQNARSLDLRAAVAERESPERIMSEARSLGMIDPGPVAPLSSDISDTGAPDPQGTTQGGSSVAKSTESAGITP